MAMVQQLDGEAPTCQYSDTELEPIDIDVSDMETLDGSESTIHVCTDIACLADNHPEPALYRNRK